MINNTVEFNKGKEHRAIGHSIYYNPYHHKGTAKQYTDWEDGWKSAKAVT